MKKSLFLAALATIALASCTQNESIVERQEIGFSPLQYKAVDSKSIIEGNTYPSTLPFGLYAYHTDGTNSLYIEDAECSYSSTYKTFISNPVAYWPLSGTLGMVAWSPSSIEASYTLAEKKLSISFEAVGRETGPVDLMYSTPLSGLTKDNHNSANYTGVADGGNGVGITFNHALSQIVVTAKVADVYTGATFTINSISLQGMNDNATLTVTESATPVASWGATSNNRAVFNILSSVTNALSTTADEVGTPVLVIPQALVDQQQKLVISYSMTFNGVETTTTPAKEIVLATTDLEELAMGKKYTLNLTLYADRILYSPSVAEDWDADGNKESEDYDVQ